MTNNSIIFISDFFIDEVFGGAELVDAEIIKGLKSKNIKVKKLKSINVRKDELCRNSRYIISNFATLSPENKEFFKNLKYSIVEHDHKYVVGRDASKFKDYIVPFNRMVNIDFYKNADRVYCQSNIHSNIIAMNLGLDNVVNLSTSIWSSEHLDLLELHCSATKNNKTMILGSNNSIKNTAECISYCQENNIIYEVVGPLPYNELIKKMSEFKRVLAFPKVLESFNRFLVEARMLNCAIRTNDKNGCTSEEWFPKLKGEDLINFIRSSRDIFIEKILDTETPCHKVDFGKENHFKFVIPFHNAERWIEKCIDSVMGQSYKNFECVIIDDMSTDNSVSLIKEKIKDDDRFKLIVNKEKANALENIYNGIRLLNPSDEDIIVNLDGDDWLHGPEALAILCKYYRDDCLMTYGSHIDSTTGERSKFCRHALPKDVIDNNSFRDNQWMTSALRTFKFKLWNKIDVNDLKNRDGIFFEAAWDLAYMFPMLEMAAHKSKFVEEILYVYNLHENNDHKVPNKRKKQLKYEAEIRQKNRYMPLNIKCSALSLLSPLRFDVAAKVLYARHKEKGVEGVYAKEVYEHHLDVWGGFTEKIPPKDGIEDFYRSFHGVLADIKKDGFKEQISCIPITKDKKLLNGSHRVAAAIVYDKEVSCKYSDASEGQIDCSYRYFKNKRDIVRTGLQGRVGDSIALEYASLKPTTYMMTIYEHCYPYLDRIRDILIKYNVGVVFTKEIELNEVGKLNYVMSLYSGEAWIGDSKNSYPGIRQQANLSFAAGSNILAILVDVGDHSRLIQAKKEIRNLVGVGKPSVHTTDTLEETWRNATTCFDDETIEYLNKTALGSAYNNRFLTYLSETKRIINNSDISLEDFCVVGSAPLAAYGKRPCKDFDLLHLPGKIGFNEVVSSHNVYAHYYGKEKLEIIYNPRNYFYIEGIKFITPSGVLQMKSNRGEQKDLNDIKMFNGN